MKILKSLFGLEKLGIEKLKNIFSWDQFKDFYQYVKAFWIDFFKEAKRGTQTHLRGIKIFLIFYLIIHSAMQALPLFCLRRLNILRE